MNHRLTSAPLGTLTLVIVSLFILATIANDKLVGQEQDHGEPQRMSDMLRTWSGPYGGVPPWNLVRPDEFIGAFDVAIALAEREMESIANQPEAPTFENTIVALEDTGRPLQRLQALFGVHSSNLNVGPLPDIERVVVPKLAEYEDRVTQNEKLFARIAAVFENRENQSLSVAQQRLLEDRYKNFVRTARN